ncbi:uncharacterized protein FIBRA_09039 [Fibroporia radiculosa]|uniref:Uncharacterized protein n=1 Tax=Fibroporia radiculosa TaxID=599839 RepID=J4GXU2_9APHY|nr:uncharacterized protein FIBRA_09039 [Fibroporia radiculosa]CCM06745.1 predicted protein [Fibroporia radiculosa]
MPMHYTGLSASSLSGPSSSKSSIEHYGRQEVINVDADSGGDANDNEEEKEEEDKHKYNVDAMEVDNVVSWTVSLSEWRSGQSSIQGDASGSGSGLKVNVNSRKKTKGNERQVEPQVQPVWPSSSPSLSSPSLSSPSSLSSLSSSATPFQASLIMIPDPTRSTTAQLAALDNSYLLCTILVEQWNTINHLTRHAHLSLVPHEVTDVRMIQAVIYDWLWVAMLMASLENGNLWDVTYMSWDTFIDAMLDPIANKETIQQLKEVDVVIGGIDYTIAYDITTTYNLSMDEIETYEETYDDIKYDVLFWPTRTAMKRLAFKTNLLQLLDDVAKTVTKTYRPSWTEIDVDDPMTVIPRDTVLKWVPSNMGSHIYFPVHFRPDHAQRQMLRYLQK